MGSVHEDHIVGENEVDRSTLQFVRQVGSHRYPIVAGAYNDRHHHILTCDKESLRLWSFRKELRKVSLHCSNEDKSPPIHSLHYNSKHDFYIAVTPGTCISSTTATTAPEDTQARYAPLQTPPGCLLALGPSLLPLTTPIPTGSNFPALTSKFITESEEVVLLCGGGEVLVWDVVNLNGKACLRKKKKIGTSEAHSVLCVDLGGSGRVFSAGADDFVFVLDGKRGVVGGRVDYCGDKSGNVLSMAYLNTTRTLVVGTDKGLLLAYYASSNDQYEFELLTRFTQHGTGVKCMVYSADLFGVMSCGGDNAILLSDVVSGEAYGKHVYRHKEAPTSHVPSNRVLAHPETRGMIPISVQVNGSKRQYILVLCGELVTILRVFTPVTRLYSSTAAMTQVNPVCGGNTVGDVNLPRHEYIGQHHLVARRGPREVYIMEATNGEVQHGLTPQCEEKDVWVSHYGWYDSIERHLVGWSNGAASLLDNKGIVTWQFVAKETIGSISSSVVVELPCRDYLMVLGTTEGYLGRINLSRGSELGTNATHSSCVVDLAHKNGLSVSVERLGAVKLWNEDWSLLLASYQMQTRTTLHALYQHSTAIFLGLGNGYLQVLNTEERDSLPLIAELSAHGNEVTSIKGSWSDESVLLSGSLDKTVMLWRYHQRALTRQRSIYLPHSIKGAFFSPVKDDITVYSSHSVSCISFWQCYSDSDMFSLKMLHVLVSKESSSDLHIEDDDCSISVGEPHTTEAAATERRRTLSAIQIKVLSRAFEALAAELCRYTHDQSGLCVPLEAALPLLKSLGYHEVHFNDVKCMLEQYNYEDLDALDMESFMDIADLIISNHPTVTRELPPTKWPRERKAFTSERSIKRHGDMGMEKVVVEWNEMGEKRLSKRPMLPNTPVIPRQTPPTRTSSQGNGYVSARDAAMRMVKASKDSKLMNIEWPIELLTAATAESVCRRIIAWKVKAQVPSLLSECVYLYHVAQHGQLCEEMVAKKIEAFITSLYAASRSPLCRCMLFLLGMGPPSHSRAASLLQHAHTLFFHLYTKMQHHLGRFLSTQKVDKSRHVNLSVFLQVATEACQEYTSKSFDVLEQWLTERVVLYQSSLAEPQVPKHARAIHFEEGLELVLTLWLQALRDNTFTLPGLSRSRLFISSAEHRSYRSIFTDPAAQQEEDVWIPSAKLEEDRRREEAPLVANRRLSLASKEDFEVKEKLYAPDKPRPFTTELESSGRLLGETPDSTQTRRMSRVPSLVGIQGWESDEMENFPGRRRSLRRRGSAGSTDSFAVGPLQHEQRDPTLSPLEGSSSTLEGHRSSTLSSEINVPKVEALQYQNLTQLELSSPEKQPKLESTEQAHDLCPSALASGGSMMSSGPGVLDEKVPMSEEVEDLMEDHSMTQHHDPLGSTSIDPVLPMLPRPLSVEEETADQILADADFKQTQRFVEDMFHSMDEQSFDRMINNQKLKDELQVRHPSTSKQLEALSRIKQKQKELSEDPLLANSTDAINLGGGVQNRRTKTKSITMPAGLGTVSNEQMEAIMRTSSKKALGEVTKSTMDEELEEDEGLSAMEALTSKLGPIEIMDPLRRQENIEQSQHEDTEPGSRQLEKRSSLTLTNPEEYDQLIRGAYDQGDEAAPDVDGTTKSFGDLTPAVHSGDRVEDGESIQGRRAEAGGEESYLGQSKNDPSRALSVTVANKERSDEHAVADSESVVCSQEESQRKGRVRSRKNGESVRFMSGTRMKGEELEPKRRELLRRMHSARRIQRWFRFAEYGEGSRNTAEAPLDPSTFWSSDDGSIPPEKRREHQPTVSVSSEGELNTLPCAFGDQIRFVPLDLMKTRFSMPHWEAKEAIESDSDNESASGAQAVIEEPQKNPSPKPPRRFALPKLEPLPTVDVVIKALKNWKEYFVEAERKMFQTAQGTESDPLSASEASVKTGQIKEHVRRLQRTRLAHQRSDEGVCKDWRVSRKERLAQASAGKIPLHELEKGAKVVGCVGKSSFAFYTFKHACPVELLSVRLTVSKGVADMFLSKHSLPTFADYCAKSSEGAEKGVHKITLNPYHEDNVKGDYYIGVFGISEAEFEVVAESILPTPSRTLQNVEALTSKFRDLSPESACISLQPPVIVRSEKSTKKHGKTGLQEMMELDELSYELYERGIEASQFTFPEEGESSLEDGEQESPETEASSSPRSSSESHSSRLLSTSREDSFDGPTSSVASADLEAASTCSSITHVTESMTYEPELKKKPFRLFRSAASYLSTPKVVLYKLRGSQKRQASYSISTSKEEESTLPVRRRHGKQLPPLREESPDQDKVLLGVGFDKFKEIPESRPIPDLSILYRKTSKEVAAARHKSAMRASIRLKELQQQSAIKQR